MARCAFAFQHTVLHEATNNHDKLPFDLRAFGKNVALDFERLLVSSSRLRGQIARRNPQSTIAGTAQNVQAVHPRTKHIAVWTAVWIGCLEHASMPRSSGKSNCPAFTSAIKPMLAFSKSLTAVSCVGLRRKVGIDLAHRLTVQHPRASLCRYRSQSC